MNYRVWSGFDLISNGSEGSRVFGRQVAYQMNVNMAS